MKELLWEYSPVLMLLLSVFMTAMQVVVIGITGEFDFLLLLWIFNILLWGHCVKLNIDIEFIEGDIIALQKLLGEV